MKINQILFCLLLSLSATAEVVPPKFLKKSELIGTWYAIEGGSLIFVYKLEITKDFSARIFSTDADGSSGGMDYSLDGSVTYVDNELILNFSKEKSTSFSPTKYIGGAFNSRGKLIMVKKKLIRALRRVFSDSEIKSWSNWLTTLKILVKLLN